MLSVLPPTNGTDTSALARHAVASKAASDRALVYSRIIAAGLRGLTCSEYMHATGADHAGASARFWELSGGNDPEKYPILIAYLGEKRPTLNDDGTPKRVKARAYVALCLLPKDQEAEIRAEARNRIAAKAH